jgi:hypothetical protein
MFSFQDDVAVVLLSKGVAQKKLTECGVAKLLACLPVMRSLCIRNFVEPLHCTVDTDCTVCIVVQ